MGGHLEVGKRMEARTLWKEKQHRTSSTPFFPCWCNAKPYRIRRILQVAPARGACESEPSTRYKKKLCVFLLKQAMQ